MKPFPYSRARPLSDDEPFFDIIAQQEDFNRFGPSLVDNPVTGGSVPSKADVLAVIFDLEGFTAFSGQRDPHKYLPGFVSDFRYWLFSELCKQLLFHGDLPPTETPVGTVSLCAPPPFFAKFLGDGFLFLWPADHDHLRLELPEGTPGHAVDRELEGDLTNTVSVVVDIVRNYPSFLERARRRYLDPPPRLRCGGAVGVVCALENGRDYVGPCINQASRLQKLGPLGFAIDAVGLPEAFRDAPLLDEAFVRQRVAVRGSGSTLAFLSNLEWDNLSAEQRTAIINGS